ncbi:hypothetical protein Z042_16615 [Chania multitudinisentens RB-25]|uniref:Uncharacterized protein n=1 Tax=Chania multitudinisentens RB-25 TaxID=1441930 RepID=W0LGM8_9GAMM|nr:hypothetical protein [Chania multitudinisentens]AHG22876.1 hypothetical protein Z042_16615 [Chania multitudinisentens RB-25]
MNKIILFVVVATVVPTGMAYATTAVAAGFAGKPAIQGSPLTTTALGSFDSPRTLKVAVGISTNIVSTPELPLTIHARAIDYQNHKITLQ